MSELLDRVKRLETLLKELCASIITNQKGLAGSWGNPSLLEEADRIARELSVEHPEGTLDKRANIDANQAGS